MPNEKETDYDVLKKVGKPCHKDLDTTGVMPDIFLTFVHYFTLEFYFIVCRSS